MSYQPLTEEQFKKAQESGFSTEQIIKMESRRKKTLSRVGTELTEEPEEKRGFLASVFKRPVERLVMEPALRTTQALIASLPIVPEDIRNRALDLSTKDSVIETPIFGDFVLKGLDEGGKQVAGETLESVSWLYAPAKAPTAIGRGLAQPTIREGVRAGAGVGARAGGVSGGLFEAGESLQEGEGAGEAAISGVVGAGAGVAGGGAIGGALPVTPALARGAKETARHGYNLAESLSRTMFNVSKAVGRKAVEVPERIVRRTAEDVAQAGSRLEQIRQAPKHIADAMRQGFEDPVINFIKTGTKAEKAQRAEMLEIAKRATEDLTFMDRAKRLPGKTIVDGPAKHLVETAKQGTKNTEQVLKSLTNKKQNAINLYNEFVTDMQKIGLQVTDSGLFRTRGSRVPDQDLPFYEQIFSELRPTKKGNVPLSYQDMDSLRDRWFKAVRADDTFTDGVRGRTGYLTKIRAMMTREIDSAANGKYREAQQQTAESLQGLREFVRLIGYKGDIEKITAKDLKAGETFMRAFGNASDRPVGVLDTLYGTAKKYGYKGDENIQNQLKFADLLESVYGQPSRSIGAQIARSISPAQDPTQTTASAVREMVKWSPYSGAIRFLRSRGLLGRHETEVLRSFENLIKGEAGQTLETRKIAPLEKSVGKVKEQVKSGIERFRESIGF